MSYNCKHCGREYSSVASLASNSCARHPDGPNKGKHALYEGGEKDKYTCKNCGREYSSISALTANTCARHPDGSNKGKHQPAL